MPTAGKATGAVLFALLAFAVARMIAPDMPPGMPAGPAALVAAICGALIGWHLGGRDSAGPVSAAARGLTTALAAAFWTLLVGAVWQMLRRSLLRLYDDPVEALGDVLQLGADYARLLGEPRALALLVLGGMLAGVVTGAVARRLA